MPSLRKQRETVSHQHVMPPSGRTAMPAAASMQQLLTGSARGRPRSGRPQRAAAKPAPVSDLDTEEDEDYEVGDLLAVFVSLPKTICVHNSRCIKADGFSTPSLHDD